MQPLPHPAPRPSVLQGMPFHRWSWGKQGARPVFALLLLASATATATRASYYKFDQKWNVKNVDDDTIQCWVELSEKMCLSLEGTIDNHNKIFFTKKPSFPANAEIRLYSFTLEQNGAEVQVKSLTEMQGTGGLPDFYTLPTTVGKGWLLVVGELAAGTPPNLTALTISEEVTLMQGVKINVEALDSIRYEVYSVARSKILKDADRASIGVYICYQPDQTFRSYSLRKSLVIAGLAFLNVVVFFYVLSWYLGAERQKKLLKTK